jgi:CubicO group peptidase (beta-lactamase class C family)
MNLKLPLYQFILSLFAICFLEKNPGTDKIYDCLSTRQPPGYFILNIFGGKQFSGMNRIRHTWFLILLGLLAVLSGCGSQADKPPAVVVSAEKEERIPPLSDRKIHRVDSLLYRVLKRYRFNGTALVALNGYPIFRAKMGFKDLHSNDTLNFSTVFQLASVSKSFTAMAVLQLVERGYFSLDDTVCNYITDFPFDNITVRELLQHTAGLQNYMYYVDHKWPRDKHITNEDVLKLLNENNPRLNFRPGRKHYYSNTGYVMLALLVERVTGKDFYRYLKENIFDPLEMSHTIAWNWEVMDTLTNIATGYTRRGWRYRKFDHDPLDEVLGDKSVYSTVDDLLKWDQAWYCDVLLGDSLRNEAFKPTVTTRGRKYNYGFGWRLKERNGKKVIYHNGLWNGFTSTVTHRVDDGLTLILLSNTNAPVASIVRQLNAVLDKELKTDK